MKLAAVWLHHMATSSLVCRARLALRRAACATDVAGRELGRQRRDSGVSGGWRGAAAASWRRRLPWACEMTARAGGDAAGSLALFSGTGQTKNELPLEALFSTARALA